jgi:hypothetical protein
MGVTSLRFVARAQPPKGWRVWDRKLKRWWGVHFRECPYALLDELNGEMRHVELTRLTNMLRQK